MIKLINNNRGISLLEAVATLGIMTVVTFIMLQGQMQISGTMKKLVDKNYRERVATNIVNSIRDNPKIFQAHFKSYSDVEKDQLLSRDKVPLSWNKDGIFQKEDCRKCIGRAGYLIEPNGTVPGLLQLTLRVYDNDEEKKEEFNEYTMVFGVR